MEKRKHLKTLSNSTVTLIPKLLSFLASSTSQISPGLGGDEGKVLKFILLDVFMEEEDSLTKKNPFHLSLQAFLYCYVVFIIHFSRLCLIPGSTFLLFLVFILISFPWPAKQMQALPTIQPS